MREIGLCLGIVPTTRDLSPLSKIFGQTSRLRRSPKSEVRSPKSEVRSNYGSGCHRVKWFCEIFYIFFAVRAASAPHSLLHENSIAQITLFVGKFGEYFANFAGKYAKYSRLCNSAVSCAHAHNHRANRQIFFEIHGQTRQHTHHAENKRNEKMRVRNRGISGKNRPDNRKRKRALRFYQKQIAKKSRKLHLLQMQHALFDFLRASLIPELRTDIAAGSPCHIHR